MAGGHSLSVRCGPEPARACDCCARGCSLSGRMERARHQPGGVVGGHPPTFFGWSWAFFVRRRNGGADRERIRSLSRRRHEQCSLPPILEILPVQMITLALAVLMRREPGKFELASKITTTE